MARKETKNMKMLKFTLVATLILTPPLFAEEISSDQLRDAYITYAGKAMSPKKDEPVVVTDAIRNGLLKHMGKDHPLFAPYPFEGATLDRAALAKEINKNITKCKASSSPSAQISGFAATPENLESLSDAELVVAHRIAEDLVKRNEQQSEALDFVKECVRQVKMKDQKVFGKLTDANILLDVEAEVRKRYGKQIKWEEMFGNLSELSDNQIKELFSSVLTLKHPGQQSQATLTDKRGTIERTVQGTYTRFTAEIAPEFRHLFRDKNSTGFGVYIIEGQKYWEPFDW